MTRFVSRLGRFVEADEVFDAWASGDLPRVLRALQLETNLIDRHFLLMNTVVLAYKKRDDPAMRRLCREVGILHVEEFAVIAPALRQEMGGFLPRVPTFETLAKLFAEEGEYQRAIEICEKAQAFGLRDGTKGDYPGRIARLRKKAGTQAET